MPKKKSVAEMSEKERRRHSKKIEKQIRQGKKKIKLPDGRVLDGKRIREQRTTGSELRGYYQRIQLYLTGVVITAITARVFTAWEIPAGFRVLVFLLCVPIFFGLQVLLNALVPQKVNHEQRQIVVEGGGSYYNALFTLAMTIELTKFVQYFLAVVRGASDSTDEGDDAESITADGETPDDENWTPPPPKKQFFEMSQQSNMTKVFLYGIPFMFGAAVVLFGMVAFLRATSRDPLFGGNNLRSVRVRAPVYSTCDAAANSQKHCMPLPHVLCLCVFA